MDERNVLNSYVVLCHPGFSAAHRATLLDEIFPSFEDAASMVQDDAAVSSLVKTLHSYSRRSSANARIVIGSVQASKLVNMCLFVADMLRIGILPAEYDHAEAAAGLLLVPPVPYDPYWNIFTIERGVHCHVRHTTRSRTLNSAAPSMEQFPKFPTSMSSFYEYNNQTNAALKAVIGTNGVPLAYLVRETQGDPNELMPDATTAGAGLDFEEISIQCTARDHPGTRQDEHQLYEMLYPRVVGTEAISFAPANHETERIGSYLYSSVWGHYKSNHVGQAQALSLDAQLAKLHYKGERSMKFDLFINKLNLLWTQKEVIGEGRDPPEKIRQLLAKVRKNSLMNPVVCQINARPISEKQTEAHYLECVRAISTFVGHIDDGEPSANRRQVSEVSTGGRGRGGRGRGKGRGKGRGGRGGRGGNAAPRGGKFKKRGKDVSEWMDHTGSVPHHIFFKWSAAERQLFNENREKLQEALKRTVAAIRATHPAAAPSVSFTGLPPLPPTPGAPVVPAQHMVMGRAGAQRTRAIAAATQASAEAVLAGLTYAPDAQGNMAWR